MWDLKEQDLFELQEFLIAKFTHDLAGELGAIDNTIDFLDSGEESIKEKALNLLKSSAAKAVAKLKFFRYAFGNIKNDGEADLSLLNILSQDYFRNTKMELIWDAKNLESANIELTAGEGKLILNIIYLVSTILIHGGQIEVNLSKKHPHSLFSVTGKGKNLKKDENLYKLIVEKTKNNVVIDAKSIQKYFTSIFSQKINTKIEYEQSAELVTFSIYKA